MLCWVMYMPARLNLTQPRGVGLLTGDTVGEKTKLRVGGSLWMATTNLLLSIALQHTSHGQRSVMIKCS